MKWSDIIELIAQEFGSTLAQQIECKIKVRFGGERVTISKHETITTEKVNQAAPGKPKLAAKKLGIHPSTAYRVLRKGRVIR